jgi:hypothetical protein
MDWLGWLKRSGSNGDRRTGEWRRMWAEATEAPDEAGAGQLRARLRDLAADEADADAFEIEREMLEGLDALVALAARVEAGGPPRVATGHRAVGTEPCHFSAPASMPDDPAQPSGTLLLTPTKLIFVGGSRGLTVPWHSVARCLNQDRDLVLVRRDRDDLHRLRCNTFADALCAGFLVRQFARRRV